MVSKYKCDDAGSTCSDSSVDTNEALSEMLGLPPASSFDGLLSAATEEVEHLPDYGDCVDDDVESATTATTAVTVVRDRSRKLESKSSPLEEMRASETTFPPPPPRVSSLDVPRRCSRYLHHPSDVAAFALSCWTATTRTSSSTKSRGRSTIGPFHDVQSNDELQNLGIEMAIRHRTLSLSR